MSLLAFPRLIFGSCDLIAFKAYTNLILGYVDGGAAYMFNKDGDQRPSSSPPSPKSSPLDSDIKSIEVSV